MWASSSPGTTVDGFDTASVCAGYVRVRDERVGPAVFDTECDRADLFGV